MLKNRLSHGLDCARCAVHYLCVAKNLDTTALIELNALIKHFTSVSKGEHIFRADDPMHNLYAIHNGACKDYRVNEEGNERIGNFYLPGDIIGLESIPLRTHLYSLVALEDTQLCIIPIDELFELMQKHEELLKRVMNITSYKMQNDQHISISTNASQRIADFILNILLRLEERNKYYNHISLPMSQLDVSNFLGMTHETVNRIFRKLSKEKIIKINKKKIYITDIQRLKELATPLTTFGQIT